MTTYNLPALDSTHALTTAMTVASTVNKPTEDYSDYIGTAEIDLTLALAKSLFKIHSDSIDVTDADAVGSDFAIKLNNTNWPDIDLSTRNVVEADRADNTGTDQTVAKNYVRQLAKDFLDVSGGVDIFTNEEDLAQEVTDADSTLNAAIKTNLGTNGASVAINSAAVSSELFAQKYGATTGDTSWLSDFASDFSEATATDGVYELDFPFVAGDKLVFGVEYTRAATDLGGISKTAADLLQQYKVTINIVADAEE